jgi:hypothetical protein
MLLVQLVALSMLDRSDRHMRMRRRHHRRLRGSRGYSGGLGATPEQALARRLAAKGRAMSDQHVRIYYSVVDDPKFATIYPNDLHFLTYIRLLMEADKWHPSPAPIPRKIRKPSLTELVRVGIVDLVNADHYRIHGLEAERERRSRRGQAGAAMRWGNANALRDAAHSAHDALLAEGKQEQEQRHSRSSSTTDPHILFEELTGRFPSAVNQAILDEASGLFGSPSRTCSELVTAAAADKDWTTLAKRVKNVALREERDRRQNELRDERTRNAAKRAPLPTLRYGNTADISDEEAERLAREHLRRSA